MTEPDLVAALTTLGRDGTRRPLLVALDFDGTLAPLQDDPAASRILPPGDEVLARIAAAPGVALALVSGRALADLHKLAQMPAGTFLVGSHGAERARVTAHGLDRDVVQLTDEQADRLSELGARALEVSRGRDGVWVESKPTAVVVHTRLADAPVAQAATAQALELGARLGTGVIQGRDVVEITVLRADKGEALVALRDELDAAVVLYAGDDVTDEHALETLRAGDVGIKVGTAPSVAPYRAPDPAAVVAALGALADALG